MSRAITGRESIWSRDSFPSHITLLTKMNVAPPEILEQIASHLNAEDLGRFRQVNRLCARVGISLIARNGLSVLNTSAELKEIRQLLQCQSIATSTRQLTISHGDWPVCTRKEWEIHPLLFGGQSRFQTFQTKRADKAFTDYLAFIAEEQNRRHHQDVNTIFEVLSALPNLRTVAFCHMKIWALHPSRNTKYRELQQRIWLTPHIKDDNVAPAVQIFLLAFSEHFSNITCLTIHGTFNPAELYLSPVGSQFPSIHTLRVTSLQVQENEDVIQKFLLAFPNLIDLSVTFKGWDESIPDIVGELFWPHLKRLRLDELWASEEEIFTIFKHHQHDLEQFSLGNTMITQGSWRSLFTRIRNLHAQGQVIADGELYGRRRRDTLNMDHAALTHLIQFMQDGQAQWPFGVY